MARMVAERRIEKIFATMKVFRYTHKYKVALVYDDQPLAWGIKAELKNKDAALACMDKYARQIERVNK